MPNVDLDKKKRFKTLKANLSDQKSSIWLQKVFLNDFKIKKELVMKDGQYFSLTCPLCSHETRFNLSSSTQK